jgi:uncharacterized protein YjbJ (UPF0337 family)
MNKTVSAGQVKTWPGQVAGDPAGQAAGKFDQLIGALQQKFGYSRERAARELKRRLAKRAAR